MSSSFHYILSYIDSTLCIMDYYSFLSGILYQVFSRSDADYANSSDPIDSTEYSLCSFYGWFSDTSGHGDRRVVAISPVQCYSYTSLSGTYRVTLQCINACSLCVSISSRESLIIYCGILYNIFFVTASFPFSINGL